MAARFATLSRSAPREILEEGTAEASDAAKSERMRLGSGGGESCFRPQKTLDISNPTPLRYSRLPQGVAAVGANAGARSGRDAPGKPGGDRGKGKT